MKSGRLSKIQLTFTVNATMSLDEFRLSKVLEGAGTAGKGKIRKSLGISSYSAESLCKSLFRKGYLEALPGRQYRLARKGLAALLENRSHIRDYLKQKMILLDEHIETTRLRLAEL